MPHTYSSPLHILRLTLSVCFSYAPTLSQVTMKTSLGLNLRETLKFSRMSKAAWANTSWSLGLALKKNPKSWCFSNQQVNYIQILISIKNLTHVPDSCSSWNTVRINNTPEPDGSSDSAFAAWVNIAVQPCDQGILLERQECKICISTKVKPKSPKLKEYT